MRVLQLLSKSRARPQQRTAHEGHQPLDIPPTGCSCNRRSGTRSNRCVCALKAPATSLLWANFRLLGPSTNRMPACANGKHLLPDKTRTFKLPPPPPAVCFRFRYFAALPLPPDENPNVSAKEHPVPLQRPTSFRVPLPPLLLPRPLALPPPPPLPAPGPMAPGTA